jgi:hypothetical protein
LEKHVREPNMKAKYLVLLKEPFSLDMPYADRQPVVVCRMSKWPQNGRRAAAAVGLDNGNT